MPDEIEPLTEADDALLTEARKEARCADPLTRRKLAEMVRQCRAAKRFRENRERERKSHERPSEAEDAAEQARSQNPASAITGSTSAKMGLT